MYGIGGKGQLPIVANQIKDSHSQSQVPRCRSERNEKPVKERGLKGYHGCDLEDTCNWRQELATCNILEP